MLRAPAKAAKPRARPMATEAPHPDRDLCVLAYTGAVYEDFGAKDFNQQDDQAVVRRAIRRLEALDYSVSVESAAPEAS